MALGSMEPEQKPVRLDVRLTEEYRLPSRSYAQSLIKAGKVKLNGRVVSRPSEKIAGDDHLSVDRSELEKEPEEIELEIIYEDDDCVVINKPSGILSHSKGAFNPEPTVASWLANYEGAEDFVATNREGIVHRLDRSTSGVMICAKNSEAMKWLQKQFSTRKVIKTYIALVEGEIEPREAIIDVPIERNPNKPQRFRAGANGKPAQTRYKTEEFVEIKQGLLSLVKLIPKTGRTHQLRVHMAYLKHPIVGDTFYGGRPAARLYLHALSLKIQLLGGKVMTFNAGLPEEFEKPNMGTK